MKKSSIGLSLAAACALAATSGPAKISWGDWRSLPEGIAGGAAAYMGENIVYAGGTTWRNGVKHWLREVWHYSPKSDTWASGPALPEPLAYGAYLQGHGFLEIFGGFNQKGPSQNCWLLERGASTWKSCGVLPANTVFARAASVDGRTYLFGGCANATDLSTCSTAVSRRDEHGQWTHVTDLPDGAVALAAIAELDGRVYLFGGCSAGPSGRVENRRSAYRYEPAKNEWKRLRPLPRAVRSATALSLSGNRILIAGGYDATPEEMKTHDAEYGFSRDVWIYDVDTDTYERATSLPFGVSGMELTKVGSTIVGVGGENRLQGRSPNIIFGNFDAVAP